MGVDIANKQISTSRSIMQDKTHIKKYHTHSNPNKFCMQCPIESLKNYRIYFTNPYVLLAIFSVIPHTFAKLALIYIYCKIFAFVDYIFFSEASIREILNIQSLQKQKTSFNKDR